jgi:tRNA-specific 2-thiouridylase
VIDGKYLQKAIEVYSRKLEMNSDLNPRNSTVFVGLSGGVDSAVTAAILNNMGFHVVGVFMKNWAGEQGLQLDCPWKEDQESAESVAKHLGIEFASYNFEKEYKKYVLDYFFDEYKKGRVPNPDILCNSEIKFKAFLQKSLAEGADYIATGHYVSKVKYKKDQFSFEPAVDQNKDQTYFLADLSQEQIRKSLFPLGGLLKSDVRQIASELLLPNANRKDSQGICFIGDLDVQEFLRKYISTKKGDIIDIDSNQVVGTHDGISFYTRGQRKGIGIGGSGLPYYVIDKDVEKNILFVGKGRDHEGLNYSKANLELANNIVNYNLLDVNYVKIRYNQEFIPSELKDATELYAKDGQVFWAPSPGQSAVVYDENKICLGRYIIKN